MSGQSRCPSQLLFILPRRIDQQVIVHVKVQRLGFVKPQVAGFCLHFVFIHDPVVFLQHFRQGSRRFRLEIDVALPGQVRRNICPDTRMCTRHGKHLRRIGNQRHVFMRLFIPVCQLGI